MLLVPTIGLVVLASATASSRWSDRDESVSARSATLSVDALMKAYAAVTDEYVPSAAIVFANHLGVSVTALDHLLGIDFAGDLTRARALVNAQTILRTNPQLARNWAAFVALRSQVDNRTATFARVQQVFAGISADIDDECTDALDALTKTAQSGGSSRAPTENAVAALRLAFSAFTAGLNQSTYAASILTTPSTPAVVGKLIETNQLLASATAGFPGDLGPRASAAWTALSRNPTIRRFNAAVDLAVSAGLHRAAPPYGANPEKNAEVFKGEIAKVTALNALVLAASTDLRTTAGIQQNSATRDLVTELVLMVVLVSFVVAAALWMARSVSRPLDRIAEAAGTVRAGDFDLPPLEPRGPRELASAALAFNEMTSTLRAVEAHAVALTDRSPQDPRLQAPLPGRTGQALQRAFDRLQESVHEGEVQREQLHQLATHDSLTGLLNRGAAVDAVERYLAQTARDGGVVALLFIDLDGLKQINDTYGHQGGDEALLAVAEAINATTRRSDVRARLGGDEFVVAQLHSGSTEEISALAERIRQHVADARLELRGHHIAVRCSIGIAQSIREDLVADPLLRRADRALYAAKQGGRDRVAWYDPMSADAA
jgi:diguanylate cyclase (GGDEF)-like protein